MYAAVDGFREKGNPLILFFALLFSYCVVLNIASRICFTFHWQEHGHCGCHISFAHDIGKQCRRNFAAAGQKSIMKKIIYL